MKNIILLTLFLFMGFSINAQDLPDVVYLKNGNLIRGTIVEFIPGKSLEIKSKDGEIYGYQMSEVLRIESNASDASINTRATANSAEYYNKPMRGRGESMYLRTSPDTYNVEKGYRGFFDLGYTIDSDYTENNSIELKTSHGYQFNRFFFLGAGAGATYFPDASTVCFPAFINPRIDFYTGRVSPFIDSKVGYTFGDMVTGAYMSHSVGIRLALSSGSALNLSVGYTWQDVEDTGSYYYNESFTIEGLTARIGFDF